MSMPWIMGKGFSSTHCPRLPADFGNNFRGGTANLSPEMAPKDLRLGTPVVPPFSQAGPYSSRERQGPQCPCAQGNEKGWDSLGMSQGRLRNALFPRDCYRELFFPQMQHARVCFQKEKQNKNKTKTTLTIFFVVVLLSSNLPSTKLSPCRDNARASSLWRPPGSKLP